MQLKKILRLAINSNNIKQPHLILGSLMLIGLVLRLPSLSLGVWRDEGSTYFNALPIDLHEVINTVIYSELNPPGFYLIMHQWMQWFGAEDVIFKLPAFIFGILLIPATYALGSLLSSRKIGLIAAAVTTFAPEAIYYSQEARPCTLAALLCCLAVFLYCKAICSKKEKWYLLGFVICATTLLYVQYTGLILLASLAIIALYLKWRGVANIRLMRFFIAYILIFLLFTPWLQVFLTHLHTGLPWNTKAPWLMRTKILYENFQYTLPIIRWQRPVEMIILLALIIQASQFFSRSQQFVNQWELRLKTYTLILNLSALISTIMIAALSYGGRYMFPFAPLAWVVYSSSVINLFKHIDYYWNEKFNRLSKQIVVILLITSIILIIKPNIKYAMLLGNTDKSGIRTLAADVHKNNQEKTFYLVNPDFLGPTFGYYFAHKKVEFYGVGRWNNPEIFSPQGYAEVWGNPTLISDIEQRIQNKINNGYRQLFIVQQTEVLGDSGKMKYSLANEVLSRLKRNYPLIEKTDYPGRTESVTLYKFSLIKKE
jgi:4-amino-4-deoxy-L-arabinose transferase-like glycosyltransferase